MQSIVTSNVSPKQSPSVEIIEQGILQSAQDLGHLQIVDWNKTMGYWDNNPIRAMDIVNRWFAKRVGYTLVKVDMQKFPVRDDFPEWEHVGSPHGQVGKLYWNAFHAMNIGEIKFTDSPDIEGTLFMKGYRKVPFLGDIGQVSISTFIFSMLRLNAGDLWISVPDTYHQVILEPLVNLRDEWENDRKPQYLQQVSIELSAGEIPENKQDFCKALNAYKVDAKVKEGIFDYGDYVRHDQFGPGIVLKSEMKEHGEYIEVRFYGNHGVKQLYLKFSQLEKLPS